MHCNELKLNELKINSENYQFTLPFKSWIVNICKMFLKEVSYAH